MAEGLAKHLQQATASCILSCLTCRKRRTGPWLSTNHKVERDFPFSTTVNLFCSGIILRSFYLRYFVPGAGTGAGVSAGSENKRGAREMHRVRLIVSHGGNSRRNAVARTTKDHDTFLVDICSIVHRPTSCDFQTGMSAAVCTCAFAPTLYACVQKN